MMILCKKQYMVFTGRVIFSKLYYLTKFVKDLIMEGNKIFVAYWLKCYTKQSFSEVSFYLYLYKINSRLKLENQNNSL